MAMLVLERGKVNRLSNSIRTMPESKVEELLGRKNIVEGLHKQSTLRKTLEEIEHFTSSKVARKVARLVFKYRDSCSPPSDYYYSDSQGLYLCLPQSLPAALEILYWSERMATLMAPMAESNIMMAVKEIGKKKKPEMAAEKARYFGGRYISEWFQERED